MTDDEQYRLCFAAGKLAASSGLSLTANPYISGEDRDMSAWIDGFRSFADVKPADVTFVVYDTPLATEPNDEASFAT